MINVCNLLASCSTIRQVKGWSFINNLSSGLENSHLYFIELISLFKKQFSALSSNVHLLLSHHAELSKTIQERFLRRVFNVFSTAAGFKSHSQRVIIFQPSFSNPAMALSSLAILRFILFSHQSVLVLGIT